MTDALSIAPPPLAEPAGEVYTRAVPNPRARPVAALSPSRTAGPFWRTSRRRPADEGACAPFAKRSATVKDLPHVSSCRRLHRRHVVRDRGHFRGLRHGGRLAA